jgi:hypothetical protein
MEALVMAVVLVGCLVCRPLGVLVGGTLAAIGLCRTLEWFRTGR